MPIDISYFKDKLEKEKTLLEKELNSIGTPKKDNPADWDVVPAERENQLASLEEMADRMEDVDEREATEVPLEARLKEVSYALDKIKMNNYGICEIGGEEIENDRLEANPAARTCKTHVSDADQLEPIA